MKFSNNLEDLLKILADNGAKVYLVGGAVRDIAMGNSNIKDYDFEVFHIDPDELSNILNCELSGNNFGVFNLIVDGIEVQFSIPRSENKVGIGYNGFEVEFDPYMSLEVAARRRDFTINALYIDCEDRNTIIDPFGGLNDIKSKLLTPVSNEVFAEDPVRLLRAIQFAARFGFIINFPIEEYVSQLENELNNESIERFVIELEKMFDKGKSIVGFEYLQYFSSVNSLNFIADMIMTEHCQIYHQEGNVWIHTLKVIEELLVLRNFGYKVSKELFYAALFHDWGKVYTSEFKVFIDGKKRITAINHETESERLFQNWCDEYAPNFERKMRRTISNLIQHHMVSINKIKKFSVQYGVEFAKQLCLLIYADQMGRIPNNESKAQEMLKLYIWFNEGNKIEPIVTGQTLINMGYTPNKEFGKWLDILLDMQIRAVLSENNIENSIKSVCGKVK